MDLVAKRARTEVTFTVHTCTCRANWTCSNDSTVSGNVTSTAGQKSLSKNQSEAFCRADLLTQLRKACTSFGNIVITPSFNCSSADTNTMPLLTGSFISANGTIWGPVARTIEGATREMTQYEARQYCINQGFRLPTKAELETLSRQLGYPDNFDPSPVPDLDSAIYWSSTVSPDDSQLAYALNGRFGGVIEMVRWSKFEHGVRCIQASR